MNLFKSLKMLMPSHLVSSLRPAYHRYIVDRNKRMLEKYGEREMIRRIYREEMGVYPDLDHPKKYTEKIAWLKLHAHDPLITLCADKVAVRDYIRSTVGSEYLIPLVGVYESADDLDFSKLPCDCVIKASHGSHCNLFYRQGQSFDEEKARRMLRHWLGLNYYYFGYEWSYKDVPPRIIVEQMLTSDGEVPDDYKICCCNGKPQFLYVIADRYKNKSISYYTPDWTPILVKDGGCPSVEIPRPNCLDKLCYIAEKLSAPFIFSRVDLYIVNSRIYVGEITFYPSGGHDQWEPKTIDDDFGKLLQIPGQ